MMLLCIQNGRWLVQGSKDGSSTFHHNYQLLMNSYATKIGVLMFNRLFHLTALYKRTCEELALLGYMKSGVYEIDIDGNGPHPPAHVRCEFEAHGGSRKTVVEHNLPRDTVFLLYLHSFEMLLFSRWHSMYLLMELLTSQL